MIQKPFLGLVTGAKYDYFIFVKIMFKLGFFWSEIECRLIIQLHSKGIFLLKYSINNPWYVPIGHTD